MKKLILLFLLICSNSFSQTNEELFANANSLYKDGKHLEAIKLYEEISNKGLVSSELYFNLGNCYYKLNKVAPTIYNYERSLKINPGNKDAINNLTFAKRLTLDRIDMLPKSIFQKINDSYFKKLHTDTWGWIAIIFSVLVALFFLLYYNAYHPTTKRLFFIISLTSVVLLISTLSIAYNQYFILKNTKEAIIFDEEVSVQNEPTNNADEAFILHEGTKVFILDNVETWSKIKLIDGKIGWMPTQKLKEL